VTHRSDEQALERGYLVMEALYAGLKER